MPEDKITIDAFKIITRAIAGEWSNLKVMVHHMAQLLVGALDIKACSVLLLNRESNELERAASFGLSLTFLGKGPVSAEKSVAATMKGETIVIRDVHRDSQLQYPDETLKEGIGAVVSVPIPYLNEIIGILRLYQRQAWDISERDVDSLRVLTGLMGVAIMHTRYLNGLQAIGGVLREYPREWISPR